MSNPRKFRVWDGEEMHEPNDLLSLVFENGGWKLILSRQSIGAELICYSSQEGTQLIPHTGVSDAEETEVYQGDILEGWGRRAKIEWDGYHARWDAGVAPECTGDFVESATVIGNRYEDPTLLEESTS